MGYKREVAVLTAYGYDKTIDKIAISTFESSSDAVTYCDTINRLELNGYWAFARIVPKNIAFPLDSTFLLKFDMISKLDDRAVQKVVRMIDEKDLALAMRDADETTKEKIFVNSSKRGAQMLKEDLEFTGPVQIKDIKEAQGKIVNIMCQLEQRGEIVISYTGGDELIM